MAASRRDNAVNRAGANNSREVRGPLLVEVLAANRRDSIADATLVGQRSKIKEGMGSVQPAP